MKFQLFAPAVLATVGALVVQGCGGGGGGGHGFFTTAPITSSGPGPVTTNVTPVVTATTTTGVSRWAYTTDAQRSEISQFAVDPATGALSFVGLSAAVGAATVPGNGTSASIYGVEPSGRFLYAVNLQSDDVASFALDAATGKLVKVTEWHVNGRHPTRAAFSPDGKWLVLQTFPTTGNTGGGWLMSLSIDPNTGDLKGVTELGVQDLDNPKRFAFDPSGKFLYGCGSNSDTGIDDDKVEHFSFDSATGTLAPVAKVTVGSSAKDIVFDPTGARAFVLDASGGVTTYARDVATGALTAASTVAGTGQSYSIAIDQKGTHVYVTEVVAVSTALTVPPPPPKDGLLVYAVDAATGALTPVGNVGDCGQQPGRVRLDPSGKFAFTADLLSDHVTTIALDPLGGAAGASTTSTVCQPTATVPQGPTSLWLVK